MTSSDVAEVRARLADPKAVVTALGLERGATRQPRGLMVCCPSHGDRTPSCSVRVGRDGTVQVKCFACDFAGDVFALVAAVHGLTLPGDFRRALEIAADLANVDLGDQARERAPIPPRPPVPASEVPLDAATFDAIATDLLQRCPLDGPDGAAVAAYLRERGLLDAAMVSGWGALPTPEKQEWLVAAMLETHGRDAIERSGLVKIRDDGSADLSRMHCPHNRLIIPYLGAGDTAPILTLQRRRITPGDPKYVFPRGRRPEQPYGVEHVVPGGRCPVVFVEGAVDVLAAKTLYARAGIEVVVLGVPGVSNWQTQWAAYAAGREARIAVDNDPAGEAVVLRMARDLFAGGARRVVRSTLIRGKDSADALGGAA